jgi:hypothetical protein
MLTRVLRSLFVLFLLQSPAYCRPDVQQGVLDYRGFTIDVSRAQDRPDFESVERSVKHQVDIVADCGASADVLGFFRSQKVSLEPGHGDGGGHFAAQSAGVALDAAVDPPEAPVLLHELLHAYHWKILPGGFRNGDLIGFYGRAKTVGYPSGAYLLTNVQEFFAVTASCYLWGRVSRPPFTCANLKSRQPLYAAWLARQFGVRK